MARMVMCAKLGRELPGLERPPIPGEMGKRIYENISSEAWDMWKAQSVLLINHYGLNLLDPEAQKFLREQMERFLFEEKVEMPEGWTPEGTTSTKGGGPPQRKK
jgi:Fe-S cluster biosynthesis and repair protein YggX